MNELLPCPFCGGEAEILIEGKHGYYTFHHEGARKCPAAYAHYADYTTEAEAIAAWNSRADYHGYEQAAIEAWESIKAWNSRAERTCHNKNKSGTSFWCSKCDAATSDGFADVGGKLARFNYCPNCGRKCI